MLFDLCDKDKKYRSEFKNGCGRSIISQSDVKVNRRGLHSTWSGDR
jgi:hypothetical protein